MKIKRPLLGPITIFKHGVPHPVQTPVGKTLPAGALGWVVVGGESGPGARPCDIAWIRSIVDQCKAADVPVFVKQLGATPYLEGVMLDGTFWHSPIMEDYSTVRTHPQLSDRKGGDMSEWPEDLRVRQMPEIQTQ